MPTYDYRCTACGHAFEHFQGIAEPLLLKCPACGRRKLERLIGAGAGLIFRGKGFYITDYRPDAYAADAKKDAPPAAEKSAATDAKAASKSDAKADARGDANAGSKGDSRSAAKGCADGGADSKARGGANPKPPEAANPASKPAPASRPKSAMTRSGSGPSQPPAPRNRK
jgi:putative FmdB family regulatory protein